jgi:phosphate transport system substrate-binding protein
MIKVNGVAPTQENISSEEYPITASLYAVTYEGNPNENVQKLIDWILSDEGQEIVEKTGYARVK